MISIFTYRKESLIATLIMKNGEYAEVQIREEGSRYNELSFYSSDVYSICDKIKINEIEQYWDLLNVIDINTELPIHLVDIRY